ncbi:murein biosynthesis integral membrane protein MurJ [bacterium]|nr:MAG: murein biosynthesis integral membrane protein MurJ [bacterium]
MPESATQSASPAPAIKTTRPLQAVAILSALYFLARFTGLLQRQIISALLPSATTDAYTFAFGLPDLLNYMVAGGAISLTFIPIFTKFWDKGREAEAWRFFSTLISVMGVALVGLTAFMMLFTPQLLFLRYPGIVAPERADTYNLTIQMTRIILPAQLFFYLGGLMVGVLNTFKRFGASGWTSALNNVVAIVVGVVLFKITGNAVGFAWGLLLGAFAGNFLLPFLAVMRGPKAQQPRFVFRFRTDDPAVRRFFILALPIMFGVSLPVVDQFVVTFFASSFPTGSVTHLENANRLMIAAQGVIGQAAAVAAFPYMASENASGDFRAFSTLVRSGLRRLLFVTMPISVLLVLWAQPITRLLYGYGEFNDPIKLHETSLCFALYTIGLFAWVGQGFVARGFYAMGDTKTPTFIGTFLTFVFFIPLCFIMKFHGAPSLALATSIGAAAYFISILVALDRRLKMPKYKAPLQIEGIIGTILRTATACLLMAITGWLALKVAGVFIVNDKLGDIGLILWSGAIAGAVFWFSATAFAIPEWLWLKARITKFKRSRS